MVHVVPDDRAALPARLRRSARAPAPPCPRACAALPARPRRRDGAIGGMRSS